MTITTLIWRSRCHSVLQYVVVCWCVLQCIAVYCSVLQCVAMCRSVLQCVVVYCSVLQCVVVFNCALFDDDNDIKMVEQVLQCVTVC